MIKFNQSTQLKSLADIFDVIREVAGDQSKDLDPTHTVKCFNPRLGYFVVVHGGYGITFLDIDLDILGVYAASDFGTLSKPEIPQDFREWFIDGASESCTEEEWHPVTVKSLEITSE